MRPVAHSLPFGRNVFIPAGCIHYPLTERDILKRWIQVVKETPNSFTLLCGDSLDFARTHYRNHLRTYREDQNSQGAIDAYVRQDIAEFARMLEPIKHKIIGAVLGNHYHETAAGLNSEQILCEILGIRYLGPVGVVRLDFFDKKQRRHHLLLYAHHHGGSMGGRTTGADVTALERSELTFDADIYVLSHTHRRFGFKLPKLEVTPKGNPRVIERTKVFIRSGAFLKGYGEDSPNAQQPHFPSYAEQKALRPTDLGFVSLTIDLTHLGNGKNQSVKCEYTVSY